MKRALGFALVELLVVVAIITFPAGIMVPRTDPMIATAHIARATAEVHNIEVSLTSMLADVGKKTLNHTWSLPSPDDLEPNGGVVGDPTRIADASADQVGGGDDINNWDEGQTYQVHYDQTTQARQARGPGAEVSDMDTRRRTETGMTLVAMLVVMAFIALLAGNAVPMFIARDFGEYYQFCGTAWGSVPHSPYSYQRMGHRERLLIPMYRSSPATRGVPNFPQSGRKT